MHLCRRQTALNNADVRRPKRSCHLEILFISADHLVTVKTTRNDIFVALLPLTSCPDFETLSLRGVSLHLHLHPSKRVVTSNVQQTYQPLKNMNVSIDNYAGINAVVLNTCLHEADFCHHIGYQRTFFCAIVCPIENSLIFGHWPTWQYGIHKG